MTLAFPRRGVSRTETPPGAGTLGAGELSIAIAPRGAAVRRLRPLRPLRLRLLHTAASGAAGRWTRRPARARPTLLRRSPLPHRARIVLPLAQAPPCPGDVAGGPARGGAPPGWVREVTLSRAFPRPRPAPAGRR